MEVFIEAKNNYRQLGSAPLGERSVSRTRAIVLQMTRQIDALPEGAMLEWHVTDPHGAQGVRMVVDKVGFGGLLDIIYTPEVRWSRWVLWTQ